jgi:hypothetical protein
MELLRKAQGIFGEVIEERMNQIAQWGGTIHDDAQLNFAWPLYVNKQLDKLLVETQGVPPEDCDPEIRARLIKVAALAFAGIEALDRKAAK